ncbi:MAG: sulfur carrier protein [Pseudonocardiales bacterium]|nr:thiamine biosynthesis protein ThiS [Frankiales bacterium]MDQ1692200.1 sulfur carrier protein [Pseudonocardiales bacterium]MDQ1737407.1 sulfur carrier protein [Pseudonocardiales bacterium]
MRLTVNGLPQLTEADTTLADLITAISDRETGIAVAVNSEVVPRSSWPRISLNEGDRVDVVTAVQGG